MGLRDRLLDLVAPTGLGDELVPGARLIAASTELGARLTFAVAGSEIHVEVAPIDANARCAARSRRLQFSYRVDGGAAPERLGLVLCEQVARVAVRHEQRVLDGLAEAAARASPAALVAARIREVRVTRLLERAGTPRERFYTLSPYVGCLIGCRFCYAQSKVGAARRLEGLPLLPWGSYVDVRTNAPEVLAQELDELAPEPIKFCPIVSDPYQVVERSHRITRRCLVAIRDARRCFPALILTRSTLIEEDAELIGQLPIGYAGISLSTIDDEVRRHFDPRGAPVLDRLAALRRLRAAGARTFAVVQPLLPGPIEPFAAALAEVAESVSIDVLRGEEGATTDFDHQHYAVARSDEWQRAGARALAEALHARGVATWEGELPPDLRARFAAATSS